MKFIIKLFPEITIKSSSVRLRFIKILSSNIRNILRGCASHVSVVRYWDHIEVYSKDEPQREAILASLMRIPGIHHILEVETVSYQNLHDIFTQTLMRYRTMLEGKRFCVRVKRKGQHPFNSQEVERYVGGGLNQHILSATVDLTTPQETVKLEIEQDKLTLVMARYTGLSGFPIGTQEGVLSLISGGFDSSVASYMLMRRGSRVHYCFFNLGGPAHEVGVKQMAYDLWYRFGRSHKVRFITVDFSTVVNEILHKIEDGQMGVVLKRMMVRAASTLAERYNIPALVTGEAIGQVSSQTLSNLRLIDQASQTLVLRPLIAHDKEKIIQLAREIGTEALAKSIPEFCGVISKKPTIKAVPEKIALEEAKFDFNILHRVVQEAQSIDIRDIITHNIAPLPEVETVKTLQAQDIIVDIRAVDEQETRPLNVVEVPVLTIPFYRLANEFSQLAPEYTYLLYCERGMMSKLQAVYLHEQGYHNIKVYHPVV